MKPSHSKKISRIFTSKQNRIHQLINQTQQLEKLNKQLKTTLPKPLTEHCSVANQKGDRLVLFIDSPAWNTKIRLLKPSLIKALRPLGINQIETKIKPIEAARNKQTSKQAKTIPDSASNLLSQLAETIPSKKLKQALLRLSRHNHQ